MPLVVSTRNASSIKSEHGTEFGELEAVKIKQYFNVLLGLKNVFLASRKISKKLLQSQPIRKPKRSSNPKFMIHFI